MLPIELYKIQLKYNVADWIIFYTIKFMLDSKLVYILLITLPKFISASIYSRILAHTQRNLCFWIYLFRFNTQNDSLTAEASCCTPQVSYCTPTHLKTSAVGTFRITRARTAPRWTFRCTGTHNYIGPVTILTTQCCSEIQRDYASIMGVQTTHLGN
jgi:hypothetical protein